MEECVEKLREKNTELEGKISKLSVENERLRSENYSIESELREIKKEKDRLLQIIEYFSKGYANMKS